jgi:hypothetical protein
MGLITLTHEHFFIMDSSSSVTKEPSKEKGRKKQTDASASSAESDEWTNSTTAYLAIDREASVVQFPPS